MLCRQCQRENLLDSIFCEHCGARLEAVCSHCGAPTRRGASICRMCGQTINQTAVPGGPFPDNYVPRHHAEKILRSQPFFGDERKQATFFFADIRDSMILIINREPEEAQKVIHPV